MLVVDSISKNISPSFCLRDITFDVGPGQSIGILGPNGSGKSTLLRLIAGLMQPDAGEITLLGKLLHSYSCSELARHIAVLSQNRLDHSSFTVEEIVKLGRYPFRRGLSLDLPEDMQILESAMKEAGIFHLRNSLISHLSGGEQQRVAIAMAMAQTPKFLLLDEPTTFLDLKSQVGLLKTLGDWKHSENLSIVMILHDINMAALHCDKVLFIREGEIISFGEPNKVIDKELIKEVYGVGVELIRHPICNKIQILL